HYILGPLGPDTDLRRYGLRLCERGGKNAKKRAAVAVARKLAVFLHPGSRHELTTRRPNRYLEVLAGTTSTALSGPWRPIQSADRSTASSGWRRRDFWKADRELDILVCDVIGE